MEIKKELTDNCLKLILDGRLDATSAPDLEEKLQDIPSNVNELVLDFQNLQYISSAGLRVIVSAQKLMISRGNMKIVHVIDTVMDVFKITGFDKFLTIDND